jgi:hypothetical protein
MLRGAMATRKKPTRKPPKKKPLVKKKAAVAKKPAARKPPAKRTAPKGRTPPMHRVVSHPELSDSETEHDEAFEVFKSFDRDGSGSIDRRELARLLEALGQAISEEELEIALDAVDSNRSGRISWDEFKAWWSAR